MPPPVTLDADGPQEPIADLRPGYLLTLARSRAYKNVRLICETVAGMENERLVVVGDLPAGDWPPRVRSVSGISDAQVRWLYANCRAVVAAAKEDFGLTPIEGFAFGRPAVALRAGGYLDTVVDGVTGVFFNEPTPSSLGAALMRLRLSTFNDDTIKRQAELYSINGFVAELRNWVINWFVKSRLNVA
jgi:glycosyltransferase involved in cell wall biosynthesis